MLAATLSAVGNGVATLMFAKWTGDLNTELLHASLNHETWDEAQAPEVLLDKKTEHMALPQK